MIGLGLKGELVEQLARGFIGLCNLVSHGMLYGNSFEKIFQEI